MIYAAHVAFTARINHQAAPKNGRKVRRLIESEQMDNIVLYGADVEASLSKAKNDLMLMSHVGDYSSSASYEAVGPAYVLLTLLRDLFERTNEKDGLNLLRMYKSYIGRLDFQVKHHPRRRLRNGLVHFRGEIRTVQQIMHEPSDIITQLCRTLRPASFKVTSLQRVEQYKLEEQAMEHVQLLGRSNLQVYDRHIRKLERLEQEALQGVEIEQDDHGKAILVFTIVTVVFLSLSFATGFLGMNTRDIRSTDSTQWLFWSITLPLTVLTMATAVSIGYYGERIREALVRVLPATRAAPDQGWAMHGTGSSSKHRSGKRQNGGSDFDSDSGSVCEEKTTIQHQRRGLVGRFSNMCWVRVRGEICHLPRLLCG
ncbi:hypothetical protein PV04_05109 [Phialophora macrospora]|uniref:Uncharacterized protein n=1 Tax=Phialophora macrospora TaxID=1851006 RepID=A0A0D2CVP2_9EURO|nr:hypothetical protein PV04_05109 [Phialophora macrospora]